jgi:hypothetical protein
MDYTGDILDRASSIFNLNSAETNDEMQKTQRSFALLSDFSNDIHSILHYLLVLKQFMILGNRWN